MYRLIPELRQAAQTMARGCAPFAVLYAGLSRYLVGRWNLAG